MSLLAQRRAFIQAYRETGSIEAAAAKLGVDPGIHEEWSKDWLYRGAFAETVKEMQLEAEGKLPPPPPPKRPPGRPPKPKPENPPPKRPRGRPPKTASAGPLGGPAEPVETTAQSQKAARPLRAPNIQVDFSTSVENSTNAGNSTRSATIHQEPLPLSAETPPEPSEAPPPPPEPPKLEEHVFEGRKGYVKLYTAPGETPEPPAEPEKPKREVQPDPVLEISVATDEAQRALVDEYGELDRRMQLRATDTARYEALKRGIKSWFGNVPADADGTVEGEVYLLHLSACERERKIRSVRELVDIIGLDKVLDLAVVPIGALENLLGKAHVMSLTVETRTGSRRIKAIPKRPAAVVTA